MPKRNRNKENPYYLSSDKKNNVYIVSFSDDNTSDITLEISKEIFDLMDELERLEESQIQSDKRHMEQSEIMEITLCKRVLDKPLSLEDRVINKLKNEKLKKAIDSLSTIHRRRILLYYEHNLTLEQIADLENCSFVAIKYSIDVALRQLRAYFEKK